MINVNFGKIKNENENAIIDLSKYSGLILGQSGDGKTFLLYEIIAQILESENKNVEIIYYDNYYDTGIIRMAGHEEIYEKFAKLGVKLFSANHEFFNSTGKINPTHNGIYNVEKLIEFYYKLIELCAEIEKRKQNKTFDKHIFLFIDSYLDLFTLIQDSKILKDDELNELASMISLLLDKSTDELGIHCYLISLTFSNGENDLDHIEINSKSIIERGNIQINIKRDHLDISNKTIYLSNLPSGKYYEKRKSIIQYDDKKLNVEILGIDYDKLLDRLDILIELKRRFG